MGILWLVAAVLGTCFWFNTQFGFNIFSGAHWHHLAYMQASQQPITPAFYISLVFTVIITIIGLYILLRPRKATAPIHKPNVPSRNSLSHTHPAPPTQAPLSSPPSTTPNTTQDVSVPASYEPQMSRPMRLNISPAPQILPTPTTKNATQDWPELREIFESTGYVIKPNKFIDGIQISLIAIGADENIWLGAVGVPTTSLKSVIDKFNRIFEDTLEEIIINISGFVISAPDAASPGAPEILTFDTLGALREYMNAHPNPELDSDEQENFDAYSNYISIVLDYLGKV